MLSIFFSRSMCRSGNRYWFGMMKFFFAEPSQRGKIRSRKMLASNVGLLGNHARSGEMLRQWETVTSYPAFVRHRCTRSTSRSKPTPFVRAMMLMCAMMLGSFFDALFNHMFKFVLLDLFPLFTKNFEVSFTQIWQPRFFDVFDILLIT